MAHPSQIEILTSELVGAAGVPSENGAGVFGRGGVRQYSGRPKLDTTVIREALYFVAIRDAKLHADAISKKASNGDVMALRELWDRVIGRAIDNVNIRAEIAISLDV